jgi:hypothetical protein
MTFSRETFATDCFTESIAFACVFDDEPQLVSDDAKTLIATAINTYVAKLLRVILLGISFLGT